VLRQAFTVEGIRHFVLEPDGLSQPWRRVVQVRDQVPQSGPRPRCLWHGLHIVQAAKVYLANAQGERSRVIGVEQRVVEGDAAQARELILASQNGHGSGHANTSYMERLNGTFRERLATLVRRCRHLARYLSTLEQGMYLVGTHYNFCCEHEGLRRPGIMGGHKWLDQTPAMAAGITDHCWSVSELLWYRVPPERWRPQRKRGPVPRALKDLIARWCP
jgi:hypothetical protein